MLMKALPTILFPPTAGTSTTPSISCLFNKTISLDRYVEPPESDVIPLCFRRATRRDGEIRPMILDGQRKRNGYGIRQGMGLEGIRDVNRGGGGRDWESQHSYTLFQS